MKVSTERLQLVREQPRYRWGGLVGCCLLGAGLATVHWLGLVVGGALVGLVSKTLPRALLAGLGFAVFVLLVWIGLFAAGGSLAKLVATGRLAGLGAGFAVACGVLGSLIRGVV